MAAPPPEARQKTGCDKIGCVGHLRDGRTVALVSDRLAFAEDCVRADIIVTPLFAPPGCAAGIVIDRDKLKQTGALTLSFAEGGAQMRTTRAIDEDRPWSRAPKRGWGRAAPAYAANKTTSQEFYARQATPPRMTDARLSGQETARGDAMETEEADDASPLE